MTRDTNPVPEMAFGKPEAAICRHCAMPRSLKGGAFYCQECDRGDLYPVFQAPGEDPL